MNMNNPLLLQIQRCVDGELNAIDCRRLMEQLNEHPEGWKTLACGFIEDQRFRDAISNSTPLPAPRPAALPPAPAAGDVVLLPKHMATASPGPRPVSQRSYPLLTVVLGVLVAFFAGVAVQTELPGAKSDSGVRTEISDSTPTVLKTDAARAVPATFPNPDMTLEYQPPGDGTVISPSVRFPVYDAEADYEAASNRQHILTTLAARRVPGVSTTPRLMFVEVGDDIIVFEAQDFSVPGAMP